MKSKKTYFTPTTEVIRITSLSLLVVSESGSNYNVDIEEEYHDEPIL
ncbi:MAG: hypothetical protein IJV44_11175 [Prevotella sp.]|nr:hypothetical protein [Prevotella sp.]